MKSKKIFAALIIIILIVVAYLILNSDTNYEDQNVPDSTESLSVKESAKPSSTTTTGADYYVGPANCSDSGSFTKDQPFCTIQAALNTIAAGETLVVLNGVYNERINIEVSGTPGKPITIKGESRDQTVLDGGCTQFPCPYFADFENEDTQDASVNIVDQDYIILENLTVRNVITNGIYGQNTNYLTIQNVTVDKTGWSGINIYDSKNLKILSNEVSGSNFGFIDEPGLFGEPNSNSYLEESISIVNTKNFEIAFNYLHDSLKEGIDAKVNSADGIIHDNKIERLCGVGIYANEAFDLDIYSNNISFIGYIKKDGDLKDCSSDLPEYVDSEYEIGEGILLAVGDLYELSKGNLANIIVRDNTINDIKVGCIHLWDEWRETQFGKSGEIDNVSIINNTLNNCNRSETGYGPGIILDKSAINTTIEGNIITNTTVEILDES